MAELVLLLLPVGLSLLALVLALDALDLITGDG